ncbi:MAG: hypothetical protein R3F59_29335 [Myxococcota bacterium]
MEEELLALARADDGPRGRVVRVQLELMPLSWPTDLAPQAPQEGDGGGIDLDPDTII